MSLLTAVVLGVLYAELLCAAYMLAGAYTMKMDWIDKAGLVAVLIATFLVGALIGKTVYVLLH